MRRLYVSVADFRAPFDPVPFQGLGQDPYGDPRWHYPAPPRKWPPGRTYWETAYFRAPYRKGYYQDNSLFGLGVEAPIQAPPPPTTAASRWRDVRTAFNQVPQWTYLVAGGLLAVLAWKSYQGWRRTPSNTAT